MLSSCQNCGHESHCHTALWKAIDFREPDKIIKVCHCCRCKHCVEEIEYVGND
jgi:hypothetical protein